MDRRLALGVALAIATAAFVVGCGQSSSPTTTTTPSPSCAFTLSTSSTINGYPNGGSFTVAVTASASGCNWTATSQALWIHVPDGAGGSGTGAVTFTIDANPGLARSGTLTVAGEIVVVNQTAGVSTPTPACTYSLSIGSMVNGYPNGATFPVAVTTTSTECAWTAVSNATWIHVTGGASGIGNGTFTFVLDANTGGSNRSGTLTAAGEIIVVNQSS
jgi:hypothetical protein